MDAHFADAVAHAFVVAEVAIGRPVQALGNRVLAPLVFQVVQPVVKDFCCAEGVGHGLLMNGGQWRRDDGGQGFLFGLPEVIGRLLVQPAFSAWAVFSQPKVQA